MFLFVVDFFPSALKLSVYFSLCFSRTFLLPCQTLILRPVDKKLVEVSCGAVQEGLQFLPLQGNVRNLLAIKETREQLFIPSDVMDKIKVFCYYSHTKVYG